jgi:6-phosphogluconolactonase/glucosamine-6-phosphate isomerase/deaminase
MKYILTSGWDDGVADLTDRLVRELDGSKRVLWLVSGGSNVPASVSVMLNVPARLSRNLSISLIDERWGKPGHKDSNWQQLLQAGFDGKRASLLPVLRPGSAFKQSIKDFGDLIKRAFDENDIAIGQLGIGADGHIAGILPGSAAAQESKDLAAGYEAPPLKRLTLTFPALRRLDSAYVFAFGGPKRQTLESLRTRKTGLSEQPAQILKELKEAYVYNDQVGEND